MYRNIVAVRSSPTVSVFAVSGCNVNEARFRYAQPGYVVGLTCIPTFAAVSRPTVVIVAPLSTRNLTSSAVDPAIDPEMAVDRHWNANLFALDDWLASRFGLQALRDVAKIVPKGENDESAGEDRDPGQCGMVSRRASGSRRDIRVPSTSMIAISR